MSVKCIWEEYIHINLCLYLRVHMGRSQLSRLGKHRQPALFPKGSSDAGWKWQWAGSAAFGSEGPILVTGFFPAALVLSSIILLEHFHPEEGRTASWFSNLSWGILSLGAPFTNRGNIWMNSWARRSLNILTWKSPFLWIDFLGVFGKVWSNLNRSV